MFSNIIKKATIPMVGSTLYLYHQFKTNAACSTNAPLSPAPLPKKLPQYRPSDWLHMHYSVEVYQDDGGKPQPGWKLLKTHQEPNGYFGTAYEHPKHKHIIIAHRGTEGLNKKDWGSNFDLIFRRLNGQEVSAWDNFAKKVIEENQDDYSYSFTGHSLGGWLAQVCLWKYQDEFIKEQRNYQEAFAVTLDDPGAKELLEALQPGVAVDYRIEADNLDITTYLSFPNLVNTALNHVGSVYGLFPTLKLSLLEKHVTYTLKTHSSQELLKEFNPATGLPKQCVRVLDWPRVLWSNVISSAERSQGILGYLALAIEAGVTGKIERAQYAGFYTYKAHTIGEIEKLSTQDQFQLKHGIHYRIKTFDEQILPLRNMPSAVRRFLEVLEGYPDRLKVIQSLVPSTHLPPFNAYAINGHHEIVLKKTQTSLTARDFRDAVLSFLNDHPQLYQIPLPVLRDQYFSKRLETGNLPGLIEDLKEESQYNAQLLKQFSFRQGTARLYKFIKPSRDEIKRVEYELQALEVQLVSMQHLKLKLESLKTDKKLTQPIETQLVAQEQQLLLGRQMLEVLWLYMAGSAQAKGAVEKLLVTLLASKMPVIDQTTLLTRTYNLKAKIETMGANPEEARQSYQKATDLLPNDDLSWSNYGGLLSDMGRTRQDPRLYEEAYEKFQKVAVEQFSSQQLPIVASGKAYGLLLLAQSLEQQKIVSKGFPSVTTLREEAEKLLEKAIAEDPRYLNARLFSAILKYDQKDYPIALQEVNNALALQSSPHATALMRKGFILERLGKDEEALDYLEQAKKVFEKNPTLNVGWIRETDAKILEIETRQKKKTFTSKL